MKLTTLTTLTSQKKIIVYKELTFISNKTNSSIKLIKTGKPDAINLLYSKNDGEWTQYTIGDTITLKNIGDKVALKSTTNTFSESISNYYYFNMTGLIKALGNVMSLINYSDLTPYCFFRLFYYCNSLIIAPELPATTLVDDCYSNMFSNCTSLINGPSILPAMDLTTNCYSGMFAGCTSLSSAPKLPATTLAPYCYSNMFFNCTSLSSAPELPANFSAPYCYFGMFEGCTSLTGAPELPAIKLAYGCYSNMFHNCCNLQTINVKFTSWNFISESLNATNYWLRGTSNNGVFIKPSNLLKIYNNDFYNMGYTELPGIPNGWLVINNEPLTFKSLWLNNTAIKFGIGNGSNPNNINIQYSLDNINWYNYTLDTIINNFNIIYFKSNTNILSDINNQYRFSTSGRIAVLGNILSLINFAPLTNYCFKSLFENTSLISAPDLPISGLMDHCYENMFKGCNLLTGIPALPATTLAPYCYNSMFKNCTSLSTISELPATILVEGCYNNMFENCLNLMEIHTKFENWNNGNSTQNWLKGVRSSGLFLKTSYLIKQIGPSYIPSGWSAVDSINDLTFVSDNRFYIRIQKSTIQYSLDLGKTWTYCTNDMDYINVWEAQTYYDLYKQSEVTRYIILFKSIFNTAIQTSFLIRTWDQGNYKVYVQGSIASLIHYSLNMPPYCFQNLFANCNYLNILDNNVITSLLPFTKISSYGFAGMFKNCSSLNRTPELPATGVADFCYYLMFKNSSTSELPILPATNLSGANYCYANMFEDCQVIYGNRNSLPATILSEGCYQNMFKNSVLFLAPDLPATSLVSYCYNNMFYNCYYINNLYVYFTNWLEGSCTLNWLYSAGNSNSTFHKKTDLSLEYGYSYIPQDWIVLNDIE